jgi:hypothetical protein
MQPNNGTGNARPRQPAESLKANTVLWVITVAAFLGTVLAGVFAFVLFSQRGRIRDALKTPVQRRMESRTPARVEVQLLGTDAPFTNEITRTENVSQYGACVITKTKWRRNDEVTVKLLRGGLSNEARIAYCKPLKAGGAFAIGLQFSSPVVSWMT